MVDVEPGEPPDGQHAGPVRQGGAEDEGWTFLHTVSQDLRHGKAAELLQFNLSDFRLNKLYSIDSYQV